jgi:hypothetical protein
VALDPRRIGDKLLEAAMQPAVRAPGQGLGP